MNKNIKRESSLDLRMNTIVFFKYSSHALDISCRTQLGTGDCVMKNQPERAIASWGLSVLINMEVVRIGTQCRI